MARIVCGLGNIGNIYRGTRHNVGFAILEAFARRGKPGPENKARNFVYRTGYNETGDAYHLIWPTTLVNRSGWAVNEALEIFEGSLEELFIISDDFNLALGALRIRRNGSAGGHRGLVSIIETLDSDDFARLRAGIGLLPEGVSGNETAITDFVLSRFEPGEDEIVDSMVEHAAEAVDLIVNDRLELAISKYNINPTPEN